MRTQRVLHLVALSLALSVAGACGKKGGGKSNNPEGGGGATSVKKPSAEAKADFKKVADRYASARASGALSATQCESFSNDFARLYKDHGTTLTIAWFNAGAVLEECGQTAKAEEIYKQIVNREPKFDLSYNNLGVIYWNRKQESTALDHFQRAVAANPRTTAPRNNLAAALRNEYSSSPEQNDFEKAERELQTVLAVDSSNRLAYENLARLYYDRGRLKDKSYLLLAGLVVDQAMRVLKEEQVESSDLFNIQGLLFMERDNQVDALKAFKKAAELEPNHADANMNIAMISIRFRDYAQAEASLKIALKDGRQKKNIETYLGLGVAQRGLRKYKDAEASFKQAIEVAGGDPRPLYNLGILYHEHVAATGEFSKTPYETAKSYFDKFQGKAGGAAEYKTAVADAKSRMQNIDQLFKDIEEMKKLEAEAKKLEEEAKRQEEEERKRLLDLEAKAKAAAAAASAPPPAETKPAEAKPAEAKPAEAKPAEKKPAEKKAP